MIHVVSNQNIGEHGAKIFEMYRLRYEVFYKRLGWDVTVSGELEFDEYDTMNPTYLVATDESGTVSGCVRLLQTTGNYMLKNTFPVLAGDHEIPTSPRIWEASRFAVRTPREPGSRTEAAIKTTTLELFAGALEISLSEGLSNIVAVVDLRMERILRMAGWRLERFCQPQMIGVTKAVAGLLPVSQDLLAFISEQGGFTGPVTGGVSLTLAA